MPHGHKVIISSITFLSQRLLFAFDFFCYDWWQALMKSRNITKLDYNVNTRECSHNPLGDWLGFLSIYTYNNVANSFSISSDSHYVFTMLGSCIIHCFVYR